MNNFKIYFLSVLVTTSAYAQQIGAINCSPSGENPTILIYTAQDLNDFAQCVNSGNSEQGVTVKLMNNIDLQGNAFTPIGQESVAFAGVFDGQYSESKFATINNLTINGANGSIGLFGNIQSPAVIRNLKINRLTLSGNSTATNGVNMGGVVGYNKRGVISNVSIITGIIGTNYSQGSVLVGGLVGDNEGTIIHSSASIIYNTTGGGGYGGLVGQNGGEILDSHAYSNLIINGNGGVISSGGLVGVFNAGIIDNSYSIGKMATTNSSSTAATGGLVGVMMSGQVSNTYSSVAVTNQGEYSIASSLIGAYLGGNPTNDILTNSYATGLVSGASVSGGLVVSKGVVSAPLNCENSYWNSETTGQTSSSSCPSGGRTTAQMMQASTYSGFDFTNIWGITSTKNYGYPYLYSNS